MNPVWKMIFAAGTLLSAGATVAASLESGDARFLKNAAEGGQFEIQASQLADSKNASGDVKTFADEMVKDHTDVGKQLADLASSKGVDVPTSPSVAEEAKLKLLQASSGTTFDHRYAKEVGVSAHEATIKLFRKEATSGKDPDVRAFAQKTLPALEHHLEMAKTLEASTAAMK
ncbi:MAG: DUF4142 domain-containing protein [Burkholderiaceae bacterium]